MSFIKNMSNSQYSIIKNIVMDSLEDLKTLDLVCSNCDGSKDLFLYKIL